MSSPRTDAVSHEISNLPPEVILMIFKHLSVNERKPVKLVCKSWLESCNIPSLLSEEVLTCLNIYQLSDLYELLRRSERQLLNLKFEKVSFYQDAFFWKYNGLRVRSLDFVNCQFNDGILEDIIIYCENLLHLSFTYTTSFERIIQNENSLPPIKDVEKVSAKGIVRENLSSLEIFMENSNWIRLSDHILHQLCLIFPNMKILKIFSDFSTKNVRLDLSELPNRDLVTMSPVLNYLIASGNRIEELKLDFPSLRFSKNSLRCFLKIVSSLDRLTKLCIHTANWVKIEEFGIFPQSKLKSLEFRMGILFSDLTPFLSKLLHFNSSLQYLEIYQPNSRLVVTKPFYDKLISSGLKRFVATVSDIEMEGPTSSDSWLSTSNKSMDLPSLSVFFGMGEPSEGTLRFVQHLQSLQHFKVYAISYDNLQCLLKYQKKLKSLVIYSSEWMHDFDISPGCFTFNDLTDIEHLELRYPPAVALFSRTFSPDPVLAKLKYFLIVVPAEDDYFVAATHIELFPSTLLRSVDAMPFLEGFCMMNAKKTCMPFDIIEELCTKLSRLRYLRFVGQWSVDDGDLTDEHYRKLFSVCSSLRVVVHTSSGPCWGESNDTTYFFDTMKEKVVLKQDRLKYCLIRPKIGDLTISWLKF